MASDPPGAIHPVDGEFGRCHDTRRADPEALRDRDHPPEPGAYRGSNGARCRSTNPERHPLLGSNRGHCRSPRSHDIPGGDLHDAAPGILRMPVIILARTGWAVEGNRVLEQFAKMKITRDEGGNGSSRATPSTRPENSRKLTNGESPYSKCDRPNMRNTQSRPTRCSNACQSQEDAPRQAEDNWGNPRVVGPKHISLTMGLSTSIA